MIQHELVQNTPEWEKIRLGVATSSAFNKILTPVKGDLSAGAGAYENKLAAERLTGEKSGEFGGNYYTERGHELEPDAVKLYEMLRDIEVVHGGFITNDEMTRGTSVDGLAGKDGVLEIKCLEAHNHIAVLLNPNLSNKYKSQRQGQLLVAERKWNDNMFYHPKLPPLIIREERDEVYLTKLDVALTQLELNIQKKMKLIKAMN